MIAKYCSINGVIMEVDKAGIGVTDLALQRGYGIFDFFKILNNVPVFTADHLERFYKSADAMRLHVKYSASELLQQVSVLIELNNMPVSGIKFTLTGGYSPDGFNIAEPNLIITQSALPAYTDKHDEGISILTWEHQRQMPEVKTIDYLMAVHLQPLIKERNAHDVLYYHNNLITECPRSNIFIVTGNDNVLTPANNVLGGITRKQILNLSTDINITAADISIQQLMSAKEVFVTSSTKNILPVIKINDRMVGDGKPGTITQQLAELLVHRIYSPV